MSYNGIFAGFKRGIRNWTKEVCVDLKISSISVIFVFLNSIFSSLFVLQLFETQVEPLKNPMCVQNRTAGQYGSGKVRPAVNRSYVSPGSELKRSPR